MTDEQLAQASLEEAWRHYENGDNWKFVGELELIRERFPTTDPGKIANVCLRGVWP
jgi:hypothetical protein